MFETTLTKPWSNFLDVKYFWLTHHNFSWMHEMLNPKFNFYYIVEDMVTDGIFINDTMTKIKNNIYDKLKDWYTAKIHDKVKELGILLIFKNEKLS